MLRRLCAVPLLLTLLLGCRATTPLSSSKALDDGAPAPQTMVPDDFRLLFCDTYEACRQQFRDGAAAAGQGLTGFKLWSAPLPEASANDGLSIDFAYFPATTASTKLLVMTSGIHGLEGFAGSAMQALFLRTMLNDVLSAGVNVVMVHGINAYGFKYMSRYTENRVDLNRNWFVGDTFPASEPDQLYDKFNSFLNPTGAGSFSDTDFTQFSATRILPYIKSATNGTLTQATGQGQYRYPDGVEFGGQGFEPHRQIFLDNVGPYLSQYTTILHLDLHTGLGKREMQLLPNAPFRQEVADLRAKLFTAADDMAIQATGGSDFYSSFGDFSDFVCGEAYLQSGHQCVNMLLEYGTLIQTYWANWPLGVGLLKDDIAQAFTLYLTIRENQIHRFGPYNPADQTRLNTSYHDLFYPSDNAWRTMVLTETLTKWPKFLARFEAL